MSEAALIIELGGEKESFRANEKPNQWALMQNAEATKSGRQGDAMAATYKLAITSVKLEEQQRFEEFMIRHGQEDDLEDVLTEALFALWRGETRLPLEPTSSDSSTSTIGNVSTSTDDSSEPESVEEFPTQYTMMPNGSSIPA